MSRALFRGMRFTLFRSAALGAVVLAAYATSDAVRAGATVNHLYNLSSFSGIIPFNHVQLFVDGSHDEVYVAEGNRIRIFNETGMEIYRFDVDPKVGGVLDLAVNEDGDILLLAYDWSDPAGGPRFSIVRCDYRGNPVDAIKLSGLPPEFSGVLPNVLVYRDGEIYLLSRGQLLLVVTDRDGVFRKGYDLGAMLEVPEVERGDVQISGFSLDGEKNLLFTVPVLFRAFVVSPEGKLASFGKVGSAPGLFGVVAGIASDGQGHYLVADKLRSVVMVFDKEFRFVTEFGYVGNRPESLVRPDEVAVGDPGKIHVTQVLNRGVAVFAVSPN